MPYRAQTTLERPQKARKPINNRTVYQRGKRDIKLANSLMLKNLKTYSPSKRKKLPKNSAYKFEPDYVEKHLGVWSHNKEYGKTRWVKIQPSILENNFIYEIKEQSLPLSLYLKAPKKLLILNREATQILIQRVINKGFTKYEEYKGKDIIFELPEKEIALRKEKIKEEERLLKEKQEKEAEPLLNWLTN